MTPMTFSEIKERHEEWANKTQLGPAPYFQAHQDRAALIEMVTAVKQILDGIHVDLDPDGGRDAAINLTAVLDDKADGLDKVNTNTISRVARQIARTQGLVVAARSLINGEGK